MNNKSKGNKGEEIAVNYLISKGYSIKKRNFHFGRYGEIDIIAEKDNVLIFFEVKSRYNYEKFGDPLFSINAKKQANFRRAAEGYLYLSKIENKECRFDVLIINLNNSQVEQHLENAF
ncbi:MAG TPA: YraN family protein [Candidatus Kapabacteria bacterium]|jgi:putative endonuclease|nr:YraN family protein [Candidatus Kapabacteria bacterium]HOQ49053.1 YraN family protein [Candidatus Kapabacteria bacterium]HPP40880.1 YraN family protein [Candidatus Kapabacteria bacterium]